MPTQITVLTPSDLSDYYTAGEVDALLKSRDARIAAVERRLAALETVPPVPDPDPDPVPDEGIRRVGADWMRNGQPWRPRGVNAQTLVHGDSLASVENLFKVFPAGSIFRTFFLSNPRAPMKVETLQAVQQLALKYDHVLMVALSNGAYNDVNADAWRDGVVHDAAWYGGEWKAQLLPHFDRAIKPLASATNVIWQNMNEVGQASAGQLTETSAREFQHATCSEIKARAPNQLCFGGVQDSYHGFSKAPGAFGRLHDSPAIDGAGMHEYEGHDVGNWGVAGRFASHKAQMDALGKVIIIGEYGVGSKGTTTTAALRTSRARAKQIAYRTAKAKTSLLWAVAEPWNKGEPTTGAGAWERVDSPVVAAVAAA